MYVCVDIYIHVRYMHIYACVCIYTHIYIYMYANTHVCMSAYAQPPATYVKAGFACENTALLSKQSFLIQAVHNYCIIISVKLERLRSLYVWYTMKARKSVRNSASGVHHLDLHVILTYAVLEPDVQF